MSDPVFAEIEIKAKVVIADPDAVVKAALEFRAEQNDKGWTVEELQDPANALSYLVNLQEGLNGVPGDAIMVDSSMSGGPLRDPAPEFVERAMRLAGPPHGEQST